MASSPGTAALCRRLAQPPAMTDSRGHAADPASFHDDTSTLTRDPFYVVLPSPYETPEEFQLEIPTNGNDDILELTHKLLVSVVHQSNPRLLWTDVAIEVRRDLSCCTRFEFAKTSFWNLWRNHDECTASHSHAYLKKTVGECLQQIKVEVQKDVDAVDASWARRASPQALLVSCFPMAARSIVSQLGYALVSDHADTIVVRLQLHRLLLASLIRGVVTVPRSRLSAPARAAGEQSGASAGLAATTLCSERLATAVV